MTQTITRNKTYGHSTSQMKPIPIKEIPSITSSYQQQKKSSQKLIINKAFFTKTTCLKVMLNTNKECYFHWGIQKNKKYNWVKVKFNDSELGEIIQILNKTKPSVSFFHKYNQDNRQIWINQKDGATTFKVKEVSRTLNNGESEVMKIILKDIILKQAMT